jgi:hypothetical protein
MGTPEKHIMRPLASVEDQVVKADRNYGYTATSASVVSSRQLFPSASKSQLGRCQAQIHIKIVT